MKKKKKNIFESLTKVWAVPFIKYLEAKDFNVELVIWVGRKLGKENTSSKPVMLLTSELTPIFRIASLIVIIGIFTRWPLENEVGSYWMLW